MFAKLLSALKEAASYTAGTGVSSTKLVWLTNGLVACYCATLMTVGGVSVYIFSGRADPIYWGSVATMWIASLGFAGNVKNNQNRASKEIAIANSQMQAEGDAK